MHTTSDFESGCCASTTTVQTGAGKNAGPRSKDTYADNLKTYLETSRTNRKIPGFKQVNAASVAQYHQQIYDNMMASSLEDNSLKGHLTAIHHYIVDDPKLSDFAAKYMLEATNLGKKFTKLKKDNKFVGKRAENVDKIPTLKKLTEMFNDLYLNKDNLSIEDHMKMVLLAVSGVLQAPIRGETASMKIVDFKNLDKEIKTEEKRRATLIKSGEKDDSNKKTNFLVIQRHTLPNPPSYFFYIIDYKNSNSDQRNDKGDHKQLLLETNLITFFNESMRILPRKYLICSLKSVNHPIGYQEWRKLAIKVLNTDEKESLGSQVNLFRQIFVSSPNYSGPKITVNQKEHIAHRMMTSFDQLEQYKVILPDDEETEKVKPLKPLKKKDVEKIEAPEILVEDPKEVVALKKVIARRAKNQEKSSKYYEENRQKMIELNKKNYQANKVEIAKRRIISQVKQERVAGLFVTRQTTLDKHGITEEDLK